MPASVLTAANKVMVFTSAYADSGTLRKVKTSVTSQDDWHGARRQSGPLALVGILENLRHFRRTHFSDGRATCAGSPLNVTSTVVLRGGVIRPCLVISEILIALIAGLSGNLGPQ